MNSRRFSKGRAQAFLSIIDQVLSSLTNLIVGVFAARELSAIEFGAFSSAYIFYTILVGGVAALVGQVVVLGDFNDEFLRERTREGVIFSIVAGCICSFVLLAVGAFLPSVRGPLLALAICLPLLLAQDSLRYGAAALQRMEIAVVSDGLWLAFMSAILGVVSAQGASISPAFMILAWGVAGSAAGVTCYPLIWRSTSWPDLGAFRSREFLGYRFLGEYLAVRAVSQGSILLLGALVGLAATGAVRGIATLFGPLMLVTAAVASFGAPLLRRVAPERRDLSLLIMTGVLVGASAAFSVVLSLTPIATGESILGESWAGAMNFLHPMATQVVFAAVTTTTYLALRLVAPTATLPLRLWTATVVLPAFILGYALGGAVGALWGLTCASAVQAASGCVRYLQLRAGGSGLASLDQ